MPPTLAYQLKPLEWRADIAMQSNKTSGAARRSSWRRVTCGSGPPRALQNALLTGRMFAFFWCRVSAEIFGTFFFVGVNSFPEEQLTDLRNVSLLSISHFVKKIL